MATARKEAIQAARDLHYSTAVIERLASARTETEILNIMIDARRHCR